MQTVTSSDGTRIAYDRHGEGRPLVLVHGGSATRHSWRPLFDHLTDAFSLVVPDRRGRGQSDDADAYSLDREVADLAALLDAVGDDAIVFGHSFGGLVALATAQQRTLDRLVLYEPPVLADAGNLAARMQTELGDENRRAAMKLFYREGAGIPDPEQLPIWPDQVHFDLAETVVRENRAVEEFSLPETVSIEASTLLLTGERGPPHLREAVETLRDRLPKSHLAELDGVGHVGTQSAPEQVAKAVRRFCSSETPQV